MHWSTELLGELYEALRESSTQDHVEEGLVTLLEACRDDLVGLLDVPPRSDASRVALGKQILTFEDGVEYRVSTDFVKSAAQVSDALNIDELAAAQLVQSSRLDSSRLDVSHTEAAIALFYVRRQYILNIVLFLVDLSAENPGSMFEGLLDSALDKTPGQKILAALKSVEQGLQENAEKLNRSQFLGLDKDKEFMSTTAMRKDFLITEHQTLACIFRALCIGGRVGAPVIVSVLKHAATFESYNDFVFDYFAVVGSYFALFDTSLVQSPVIAKRIISASDGHQLFQYLSGPESHKWNLGWWHGGIAAAFYSFYAGLVMDAGDTSKDSKEDVNHALRKAINNGGMEFLMSLSEDTSEPTRSSVLNDLSPLVRARVPRLGRLREQPNTTVPHIVTNLRLLFEAFVTNFAEVLEEMRLNEEDSHLALSMALSSENDTVLPGKDLERFFLLGSYLYRGRGDTAMPIWQQTDSSLYQFIVWASQCQVQFMTATFSEMLASLSSSPGVAPEAYRFLKDSPALSGSSRPPFVLNWESLRDTLIHYIAEIEPATTQPSTDDRSEPPGQAGQIIGSSFRNKPAVTYSSPSTPQGLDEDVTIVLFSYLRLIYEIAINSREAREECWSSKDTSNERIVDVLFRFLKFKTPLYAPILYALSSFPHSDSNDRNNTLWDFLDSWAFDSIVQTLDGANIYSRNAPRFDVILGSSADALGLLRLLRALFESLPTSTIPVSSHLRDYTEFAIGTVLPLTTSQTFDPIEASELQRECLGILKVLLNPLGAEGLIAKRLNISRDLLVENGTYEQYLERFPAKTALNLCFERKVYDPLFQVLSSGLSALEGLPAGHPKGKAVELSLEIVTDLLVKTNSPSHDFRKPLSYYLSVIPHLYLYIGSDNLPLAKASVETLRAVSNQGAFNEGIGARKRILSILESFTNSNDIKLGLISQLRHEPETAATTELSLEVKIGILQLLEDDLRLSGFRSGPSPAHFLLGFSIQADGGLKLARNTPNGMGSGVSLFDVICEHASIAQSSMSSELVPLGASKVAELTSKILLWLIQRPSSSKLVLNYLRENQFLLSMLRYEPVVGRGTIWELQKYDGGLSGASKDAFTGFFKHRSALMEMLSLEVHVAASEGLVSLLSDYLDLLMNLQHDASRSVLSFLDFMKFDINYLKPSVPSSSVISKLFQQPGSKSALELALKVEKVQTSDAQVIIDTYIECSAADEIRDAELGCLRAWGELVPVIVTDSPIPSGSYGATFVLETIQTLVPKLGSYASLDSEFCKPLASLLVLLLERYQESSTVDVAAAERLHSLFQAALQSIQASLPDADLRTDLYAICYQNLVLSVSAGSPRMYRQKLELVYGAGDRLLQIISLDALNGGVRLKLVALLFLQTLADTARLTHDSYIQDRLVSFNLVQLLVESLKSLESDVPATVESRLYRISLTKVILSVLLQLCHTRKGAENALQSGLDDAFRGMDVIKQELSGEKPKYDVLYVVLQVLLAAIVAVGLDNTRVLKSVKTVLGGYGGYLENILRADAASPGIAGDSRVSQVANAVIVLLSLSGSSIEQIRA